MVHGLEQEYWGKVDFIYLDIDDPVTSSIKDAYSFQSQPLFVFVEPDGTEIQRWFGYVEADDFRQAFDQYLASTDE